MLSYLAVPHFIEDHIAERLAVAPADVFELLLGFEARRVAHTQIVNHGDVSGDGQNLPQPLLRQNAHPTDAQSLGSGRQPKILNRAASGIEIGLRNETPT